MRGGLTAALASLALAGACSCPGSTTGSPVPLDQLPAAYVETVCRVLPKCNGYQYCSDEHCKQSQTAFGYEALLAEIDAGWVSYDATAAGACKQAFVDQPCRLSGVLFLPTVAEVLASCQGVLTGHQAQGAPCASRADCTDGLVCSARYDKCPGTCMPYEMLGGNCFDGECPHDGGFICASNVCKYIGRVGLRCADTDNCYPIVCSDAGTCVTLAEGQPCDSFTLGKVCGEGSYCDGFSTGVCRRQSLGGGCWNDEDCLTPQTCLPGDAGPFNPGVCAPRGTAGARCDSFFDCEKGLSCGADGGCSGPRAEGQSCDSFFQVCDKGLGCSSGTCAKLVCPGGACTATAQCAEARCADGGCVPSGPFTGKVCTP